MKNNILKAVVVFILVLTVQLIIAQPPGGGGGQGQGGPPPGGAGAPVDGGAIGLLLGIVTYAWYSFKEQPAIKISTVTKPTTDTK